MSVIEPSASIRELLGMVLADTAGKSRCWYLVIGKGGTGAELVSRVGFRLVFMHGLENLCVGGGCCAFRQADGIQRAWLVDLWM